jgi:hypothetical protein
MFFTPGTEDYFHRKRTPAEVVENDLKEEGVRESGSKHLLAFVEKKVGVESTAMVAE